MVEKEQLELAIAAQEKLRGSVPDAIVEASIASLRRQLAQLDATAAEEQRKLVTVLFADLVGWTRIAAQMDPEDVRALQQAYFDAVTLPIKQLGGSVEKYIGDAVVAVFGVPQAHEDDPERAVRAALAMQEALARSLVSTLASANVLRIGIHTGLVVSRVDADGDFMVTGDTVNLASRLESAAEPGAVLVSEDTYKLVAHAFEAEARAPIQVQGKAEPVSAFRIVATRPFAPKRPGIAGLDSPLVGRDAERAALEEALDGLQRGLGGIVTVVGEAGIGKSRLVAELRKFPLSNRQRWPSTDHRSPVTARWLEGRCLSYGASIPYLLWLDVLRSALQVTVEDSLEIVAERLRSWVQALCPGSFDSVFPYLARLLSLPLEAKTLADLAELDGNILKRRTLQAMEAALACAANREPLVLVCEDLHWADPSSLDMLEHLLPLSDQTSLLMICVFRPHTDHGSWRIREIAARDYRHRHTDLWLKPLSAAESELLVGNLLRDEALPQELRHSILQQAEGNPFFVEELIRTLIDLDAIAYDEPSGRWQVRWELEQVPIPETVEGVIRARIDRLQADTRHVLQLAAVIGRIFLFRVLAAIAEEARDFPRQLTILQREEFIRERARIPELEYIFKHELTREAAYRGILKQHRKQFHRQVAEALERLFPDRVDQQAAVLAHNWECAGDSDRAVHYLVRAGDRARQAYATDEAVSFYGRALSLLEQQRDSQRMARVLMKLGAAHHNAFDFEQSRQAYEQAFILWEERPAPDLPAAPHALRCLREAPYCLDPTRTMDTLNCWWQQALFAGLTLVDTHGEVIPELARRWRILDGGRTYVFELRKDARWSDGQPVTARDFECAWKRLLDPSVSDKTLGVGLYDIMGAEAYHRGESTNLGVQVEDDTTLVVQLTEPASYFLHLLGMAQVFAVPRHVVEVWGEDWTAAANLVTCGPFHLQAQRAGVSTTLVRNSEFCGWVRGNVTQVDVFHSTDPAVREAMYAGNELDTLGLSSQQVAWAQKAYPEEYETAPGLMTHYVWFRLQGPPFEDAAVRRAFAHAIDRDELPDITAGLSHPGTGGFVPPGVPGHSPGTGLAFDPDLARQLLAEAGYPGGRGFPQMCFGYHISTEANAHHVVRQWQEILGVTIEPQALGQGVLNYGPWPECMAVKLCAWAADFPDPDSVLRQTIPLLGLEDPTYLRLIRTAGRTNDQGERMNLFRQADQLMMEQAFIAPLYYRMHHFLNKPWLKAYPGTLSGRLRDAVLEPH